MTTKRPEDIAQLLAQTKAESGNLSDDRDAARVSAVTAVRLLERRVCEALGEERLRGLKRVVSNGVELDLVPVRVRWGNALVLTDREVLCLEAEGQLCMVATTGFRPALDADLRAEDAEAVASLVEAVLRHHLELVAGARDRYKGLKALADRLKGALAA